MNYKLNLYLKIAIVSMGIASCKPPEARKPVSVKTGSFIETSIKRNQELNNAEYKLIAALIKKDTGSTYLTSQYGFWYTYIKKAEVDSLKTAGFGDLITFNYNLTTLDDTPIYTTNEIGTQRYRMDKEELFSGLREALKLLKAGEEASFIFPSQKAFGYYGDQNKIGANVPLKSNISIQSIKHLQH